MIIYVDLPVGYKEFKIDDIVLKNTKEKDGIDEEP